MIKGTKLQDVSTALLQSLLASTLSSFSPFEVISIQSKKMCAKPLKAIAFMSRTGHLEGSLGTAQLLADVVSVFTNHERIDGTRAGGRRLGGASSYPVVASVRQMSSCVNLLLLLHLPTFLSAVYTLPFLFPRRS